MSCFGRVQSVYTLTIIFSAVGCGSQPRVVEHWDQLKLDSSEAEVLELLGEPTSRHEPEISIEPKRTEAEGDSEASLAIGFGLLSMFTGGNHRWWEYAPPTYDGDTPHDNELFDKDIDWEARYAQMSESEKEAFREQFSEALARALMGLPNDDAFVVYFDEAGKLIGMRSPIKGAHSILSNDGNVPEWHMESVDGK